jgi:hypothetical protein
MYWDRAKDAAAAPVGRPNRPRRGVWAAGRAVVPVVVRSAAGDGWAGRRADVFLAAASLGRGSGGRVEAYGSPVGGRDTPGRGR